jgi:hypothetical protein
VKVLARLVRKRGAGFFYFTLGGKWFLVTILLFEIISLSKMFTSTLLAVRFTESGVGAILFFGIKTEANRIGMSNIVVCVSRRTESYTKRHMGLCDVIV